MNSLSCTPADDDCLKKNDLYRALVDAFTDGIVMQHADGSVFDCNGVAESILECSKQQMQEIQGVAVLLHTRKAMRSDGTSFADKDYPMVVAQTTRQPVSNIMMGMTRLDGRFCWLEVSASPIMVNRGADCIGVVTFLREITERKEAEEALEKRHHELEKGIFKRTAQLEFTLGQLKLAVSASNTGLWNWNLRTDQFYFSPEWKRQIGYADHEIDDGMEEWTARLHADDVERAVTLTRAYLASPQESLEIEYRMRHRDGTFRWMLSRSMAMLDENGKAILLQGSHVDITERKQSEENLLALTRELRDVSRELARVEEAERRRFAQELHDTIGSALAALSINMTIMSGEIAGANDHPSAGMAARLKDSIVLLDDTTDAVRRLMAELRPPVLDDYGLEAALRWQCELFAERSGFRFTVDVYGIADRLEPELEISLFRIAQGAITNIAKHARATNVEVMLNILPTSVTLTIMDDGVGFVLNKQRDHKLKPTWGLVSMRERAQALGGHLKIISEPGKGTCIEVTVEL